MNPFRIHFYRFLVAVIMITLLLMLIGTPLSAAQDPISTCGGQGTITTDCADQQPGNVDAQAGTFFKKAYSTKQNGGYVAHGVGMRNKGSGSIVVADIPAGSSATKAYLFWALIAPPKMPGFTYNKGLFNGSSITGSLVGSAPSPCWFTAPTIWSYRADVTSKIYKTNSGNGTYNLTGFASGTTDGSDPWSGSLPPLLDGASLVILFKNSSYPLTTVQVYNGAATGVYSELHLNMPGLNVVAPTGFAYTTFIGADGQNDWPKVGSSFFDNPLPTVHWGGEDPNGAGPSYSHGNLWDTMTVDLHSLLDPPEPDFWVTTDPMNVTKTAADCLTWVGQVVSYSSGNQDSDGDGLSDNSELSVYLRYLGADPLHKDLFVEADHMVGYLPPNTNQLNDIVDVFNNAPVANPDGTTGVHIHIDTGGTTGDATGVSAYDLGGGNSITAQTYLGADTPGCVGYDWSQFQTLKSANFSSSRAPIFHYMIFADELSPCMGTTSGVSRNGSPDSVFVKGATDFIVALGGWGAGNTSTAREGTFIHELGHNLGLMHGGNDHVNYKPNYLSVMNYFFQISGVYRSGSWGHYDYSRFLLPSLNENSLNETKGLGSLASGYATTWYCPSLYTSTWYAWPTVDWNCNGDGGLQTKVKVDINNDGKYTTLGTQNNWANITFKGGGVIGLGTSAAGLSSDLGITPWTDELTLEQYQTLAAANVFPK